MVDAGLPCGDWALLAYINWTDQLSTVYRLNGKDLPVQESHHGLEYLYLIHSMSSRGRVQGQDLS